MKFDDICIYSRNEFFLEQKKKKRIVSHLSSLLYVLHGVIYSNFGLHLMQNVHFPFIYCVEELVYQRKYSQWKTCFEKLTLDPKPVLDCCSSEFGKEVSLFVAIDLCILCTIHISWQFCLLTIHSYLSARI